MTDKQQKNDSSKTTSAAKQPQALEAAHGLREQAAQELGAMAFVQRALAGPPPELRPNHLLTLQRRVGNRSVLRLLARSGPRPAARHPVQARLVVGGAHDAYEREADRVADQVLHAPAPVQRAAAPTAEAASSPPPKREEEIAPDPLSIPLLQTDREEESGALVQRSADGSFEAGDDVEARLSAQKGGGRPLPDGVRTEMESHFHVDFGSVKTHTGADSVQLNRDLGAQAFTHGTDIFFGAGRYNPASGAGKHLLAHELTHVVQQTASQPGGVQAKAEPSLAPSIQRHPGHAQEEEVRAKPLPGAAVIRRHPGHAQEEEVQAKREAGGSPRITSISGPAPIQRNPISGFLGMLTGGLLQGIMGTVAGLVSGGYRAGRAAWNKLGKGKGKGHWLYAVPATIVSALSGGVLGAAGGLLEGLVRGGVAGAKQGPLGWIGNRGASRRERQLTARYGVQIGSGGQGGAQFSHSMLDKLEYSLDRLPKSHVRGTHLTGFRSGGGLGAASAYSSTTRRIGMARPFKMPSWLYTTLDKSSQWQRRVMDSGAMAGYDGIDAGTDRELGLNTGDRQVMAGVSDVLSRGNLVEWIVRHEMGHAVDHKIGWTQTRAKMRQFGGWRTYRSTQNAEMRNVAADLLTIAGIGPAQQDAQVGLNAGDTIRTLFAAHMGDRTVSILERLDADPYRNWWANAQNTVLGGQVRDAIRRVRIAQAQPWTLPDGGAQHLELNGRVYHMDHYDTWVSYLRAARDNNGLSNYQFSSPNEWFAEAYAAFYDPAPYSAARARLPAAARAWFERNLGQRPGPQQYAPDPPLLGAPAQGGLVMGNGRLRGLANLDDALMGQFEGGQNVNDQLPGDLRQ